MTASKGVSSSNFSCELTGEQLTRTHIIPCIFNWSNPMSATAYCPPMGNLVTDPGPSVGEVLTNAVMCDIRDLWVDKYGKSRRNVYDAVCETAMRLSAAQLPRLSRSVFDVESFRQELARQILKYLWPPYNDLINAAVSCLPLTLPTKEKMYWSFSDQYIGKWGNINSRTISVKGDVNFLTQETTTMSDAISPVKAKFFQLVPVINYNDVRVISPETVSDLIAREEQAIKALSAREFQTDALKKQIEDRRTNLREAIDYINGLDAKTG